jgi:hypothetical protein
MKKPTGPIVLGRFPCPVCKVIRLTALGQWACQRLHELAKQPSTNPESP